MPRTSGPLPTGAGAASQTLIASSVLAAPAANFDFTAIPATFNHLRLLLLLRSNRASATEQPSITFNADVAAHYQAQLIQGSASTANASAQSAVSALTGAIFTIPGNTGITTSVFGIMTVDIPCYAQTVAFKTAICAGGFSDAANTQQFSELALGQWNATTAINEVTIAPRIGTAWLAGSAAYLYGII